MFGVSNQPHNEANSADAKSRAKHTLCNEKELNERQLQLYMAGNV